MLFVYARHTPDCDHRDDPKYRRCRCPKWIDGYVDNQRLRQSAKTRSWEKAELTARSIQEAADPMKAAQPVITTIRMQSTLMSPTRRVAISRRRRPSNRRRFSKSNCFLGRSTGDSLGCAMSLPQNSSTSARLGEITV